MIWKLFFFFFSSFTILDLYKPKFICFFIGAECMLLKLSKRENHYDRMLVDIWAFIICTKWKQCTCGAIHRGYTFASFQIVCVYPTIFQLICSLNIFFICQAIHYPRVSLTKNEQRATERKIAWKYINEYRTICSERLINVLELFRIAVMSKARKRC